MQTGTGGDGLSRIVFSRHSFDSRHGPVNEPGEHSPGHSSKRARQRCRNPADAGESPLRPGGQRPWRPATLRHAQTPLPNAGWRPRKEVGAFTPPVTNPASLLQSRRSLGGVGTRFGWICLDSPLLTRSRPHLPPPVPFRQTKPTFHKNRSDLVGFTQIWPPHSSPSALPPPCPFRQMDPRLTRIGRIWSDSPGFGPLHSSPSRISRLPCTLRQTKPTFHKNRSDLLGFPWIAPGLPRSTRPSLNPSP